MSKTKELRSILSSVLSLQRIGTETKGSPGWNIVFTLPRRAFAAWLVIDYEHRKNSTCVSFLLLEYPRKWEILIIFLLAKGNFLASYSPVFSSRDDNELFTKCNVPLSFSRSGILGSMRKELRVASNTPMRKVATFAEWCPSLFTIVKKIHLKPEKY